MVKEKTLGGPNVGDLEQAILKAFYEGLMEPQHEHDAAGRRRFVFDIEIVIERGAADEEPGDESAEAADAATTSPGGLERAIIRTVREELKQPARGAAEASPLRMVFQIDITVDDGRLVHASVNEVSAEKRRPSGAKLH